MVKANAGQPQKLTVGSRVFYPGHGVASVIGVEERAFGGGKQDFYVLEFELDRALKLLLPVSKVAKVGVRALVSANKARELMTAVRKETAATEVKSDPASRRLRATTYTEALRSGSADRYTDVIRELASRSRSSKLSAGEQQSLNQALAMFVGEVSAALDMTADDVREELRSITDPASPA